MNKFTRAATLALSATAMVLPAQGSVAAMKTSASQASEPVSADGSQIETQASETRKYCVKGIVLPASRIAQRMCKTKAEWADQGIDVMVKK